MSSIIKLEIQKKTFKKKGFSILNDFKLEVEPGERLSIIGESGVGKLLCLILLVYLTYNIKGTISFLIHLLRIYHEIN